MFDVFVMKHKYLLS